MRKPKLEKVVPIAYNAARSMEKGAKEGKREHIENDEMFMLIKMGEKGFSLPSGLKERSRSTYVNKTQERRMREAEEAAERITAHRIAENEKRYPEVFKHIRSEEFGPWYEARSFLPWEKGYETDVDEIRYRVLLAQSQGERNRLITTQDRVKSQEKILKESDPTNVRYLRTAVATPRWADFDKIAEVYRERDRVIRTTGINHHVDHIVPLNGKLVCGLHVHHNLRVIEALENLKKSNKFDTEQILV